MNNNLNLNPEQKITVIFKSIRNEITTLHVKYGTTIEQLLQKYLNKIGRPELYIQKSKDISFIFNMIPIRYGDTTPVEKFFKGISFPKITVDFVSLIG